MRKAILSLALGIAVLGLLAPARTASAANVTMTILEPLGSASSEAHAINDNGQIVGASSVGSSTSVTHAVVWNNGVPTDLGTLGGTFSFANDINEAGQIVGFSTLGGDIQSHAVLWQNGLISDLGCLPGGQHCEAVSINNDGQIVGFSQTTDGSYHATVWKDGAIIDIDPENGSGSRALTNNDRGEIGGFSQLPFTGEAVATLWNQRQKAFILPDGDLALISDVNNNEQALAARYGEDYDSSLLLNGRDVQVDLTFLNGAYFSANALNDLGQVAGYFPSPSGTSVAVWQDGVVTDLGPLPGPYYSGYPNDLNNHGLVVGTIATQAGGRAVLWMIA